ncbi:DeoR/GlpR family DNA-binding transcription regulator, partial [Jeotgalibaca porci]|uniref:DeoR/GlpR family DNA-binding transcription regulator n=1 Tax=Jeotgalibaca porci TaxID=1868793 RepID=UPI0035A1A448
MFTEVRYQVIKELLQEQSIVKMQEIVQLTGSSESTIRRDLSALEEEGVLIRVHGGAKRGYKLQAEPAMDIKSGLNMDDKHLIAKRAAAFVENEDVLFFDAGSTTFEMIPFLQGKKVTVVTNGVPHASLLADLKISTILLGGKIKLETKAIIGSTCLRQLDDYR